MEPNFLIVFAPWIILLVGYFLINILIVHTIHWIYNKIAKKLGWIKLSLPFFYIMYVVFHISMSIYYGLQEI
jgi:hypothetical protein